MKRGRERDMKMERERGGGKNKDIEGEMWREREIGSDKEYGERERKHNRKEER